MVNITKHFILGHLSKHGVLWDIKQVASMNTGLAKAERSRTVELKQMKDLSHPPISLYPIVPVPVCRGEYSYIQDNIVSLGLSYSEVGGRC